MSIFRRYRGAIALVLVLASLWAGLVAARAIFLGRVRDGLSRALRYDSLRLSVLPPSLVVEGIRSIAADPVFAAARADVTISPLALFRREKPLTVVLDKPSIRVSAAALKSLRGGPRERLVPPPFSLEKLLARGARATIELPAGVVETGDLKAVLTPEEDRFVLKAQAGTAVFRPRNGGDPFSARVSVVASGRGEDIVLHQVILEGRDAMVKAEGTFRNVSPPEMKLSASFRVGTPLLARAIDLPFAWEGAVHGAATATLTSGGLAVDLDVESPQFVWNGVSLGPMRGRGSLRPGREFRVDLDFEPPGAPPAAVALKIAGGRVDGEVRRIPLDPIMAFTEVPWPVLSPAWGTFRWENDVLTAEAEFRDDDGVPAGGRYPAAGRAVLTFDKASGDVDIRTDDLRTSFARARATCRIRNQKTVEAEIRGDVTDLKQCREFVEKVTATTFPFPEVRGAGTAEVKITGAIADPRVEARMSASPAGFDRLDAKFVEGSFTTLGTRFEGRFHVEDPDARGDLTVTADDTVARVRIERAEADARKILAGLDIPLALEGRATGSADVTVTETDESVSGEFRSPVLRFAGRALRDVDAALDWKGGVLSFPRVRFGVEAGTVSGRAMFGVVGRTYDVDLRAEKIDLSRLFPGATGLLDASVAGKGAFDREPLAGRFEVPDLLVPPLQKAAVRGDLSVRMDGDVPVLEVKGGILPGDNTFQGTLRVPPGDAPIEGEVRGSVGNLDLLLPWPGAQGRLNVLARVQGPRSAPELTAVADVAGSLLPLPRFAHALEDYSGLAVLQNGTVSIRSLQGKLGGGPVAASGEVRLGRGGIASIDVTAEGQDMLLSPLERTRAVADGTARLIKDDRRFVLEGNFNVRRLLYRRGVFEKFSFSSAEYEPEPDDFFAGLALNLRIRSGDDAWMENAMGRVNGRFDLTVSGTVESPLLLGTIEAKSGQVYFQDRTFRILKGRLSFFNPAAIEPYLEIRGETYVKDYRVTIAVEGLASNIKPEFSSSPPLPPEDVLALLALGESFKRTYQADRSSTLGTASLLSFQIAEQAKRRAEGLFSLDQFRIDPFVLGTSAEMTARLTVGKRLSRNLNILYSTNLTTQREEIVRMEWELSDDFSVVGTRNEWGRISFDVKVRKRF